MKDTHFTRHEHTIMDEPGFLLRAVTWHIGSGDAIFIAWILLLIAATMHARGFHGSRVLLVTVLAVFWMALGNGITMTGLVMIVLRPVGLTLTEKLVYHTRMLHAWVEPGTPLALANRSNQARCNERRHHR
jgi:hypothetical protein